MTELYNREETMHGIELAINTAVDKIYQEDWKVWDAFNWAVDNFHSQHNLIDRGYHSMAAMTIMYHKLKPHEQKLLAMRIPNGETYD
jgi:aryl carrier-like protein